ASPTARRRAVPSTASRSCGRRARVRTAERTPNIPRICTASPGPAGRHPAGGRPGPGVPGGAAGATRPSAGCGEESAAGRDASFTGVNTGDGEPGPGSPAAGRTVPRVLCFRSREVPQRRETRAMNLAPQVETAELADLPPRPARRAGLPRTARRGRRRRRLRGRRRVRLRVRLLGRRPPPHHDVLTATRPRRGPRTPTTGGGALGLPVDAAGANP